MVGGGWGVGVGVGDTDSIARRVAGQAVAGSKAVSQSACLGSNVNLLRALESLQQLITQRQQV